MLRGPAGVPTRSQHIHTNIQVSFLGNRRRGEHHPVQVIVSSCCSCKSSSCRHEFEPTPFVDNHGQRTRAVGFQKIWPNRTRSLQRLQHKRFRTGERAHRLAPALLINTKCQKNRARRHESTFKQSFNSNSSKSPSSRRTTDSLVTVTHKLPMTPGLSSQLPLPQIHSPS